MTDQTNTVEDLYASHEGATGNLFLKFEVDKSRKVRIASEPYIFDNRFEDKTTGEVTHSDKYAWLVLDRDNNSTPAILQLPSGAYALIRELTLNPEYGNPANYDITVTKKSTNGKINYLVTASRTNSDITADEKTALLEVDIIVAMSKNTPTITSLREYKANGNKFNDQSTVWDI